jgi:hypothetical protein
MTPYYKCRSCGKVFPGGPVPVKVPAVWARERSGVTVVHECGAILDGVSGIADLVAVKGSIEKEKAIGQAICDRLRELGVACDWEYPGFVSVPLSNGYSWNFGDSNETWTGDLVDQDGSAIDHWLTEIPSTSQGVEEISNLIRDYLIVWNAQPDTSKSQVYIKPKEHI